MLLSRLTQYYSFEYLKHKFDSLCTPPLKNIYGDNIQFNEWRCIFLMLLSKLIMTIKYIIRAMWPQLNGNPCYCILLLLLPLLRSFFFFIEFVHPFLSLSFNVLLHHVIEACNRRCFTNVLCIMLHAYSTIIRFNWNMYKCKRML